MRLHTSVIVALILAAAPVTVSKAQTAPNPFLTFPTPLPNPNAALAGRIPVPLPSPAASPTIDGPMLQQGLTPIPAEPPLMGAPVSPIAPPSVFQSQTGL
jgi:hypothetical protein